MYLSYLDSKTKEHKKTKDSRDEIHETHSRIKFTRPYKKNHILEEHKVDPVEKKLAQHEQK
jgi:hypothetical protein